MQINQLSKLIDHAILLENDQKLVYIILYNSVNKQLFQKCSVYIVNVYYVKHQLRVFRLEILCSKHFLTTLINILNTKQMISTPLMMENPVRRPIVPPIVESFVSKFAFSSFIILSKLGVAKLIWTKWSFCFFLKSEDVLKLELL